MNNGRMAGRGKRHKSVRRLYLGVRLAENVLVTTSSHGVRSGELVVS